MKKQHLNSIESHLNSPNLKVCSINPHNVAFTAPFAWLFLILNVDELNPAECGKREHTLSQSIWSWHCAILQKGWQCTIQQSTMSGLIFWTPGNCKTKSIWNRLESKHNAGLCKGSAWTTSNSTSYRQILLLSRL